MDAKPLGRAKLGAIALACLALSLVVYGAAATSENLFADLLMFFIFEFLMFRCRHRRRGKPHH